MSSIAIGSDPLANAGGTQIPNLNQGSGFADTMAVMTGAVGSTVAESLAYSGNVSGATIASAATNATYSGLLTAGGSGIPTSTSGFATGGQYLTGGAGASFATTTGATSGVGGNVESILAETATSQAYLIGIQAQMGQQQSTFTAISNALNVKYSMERSAIQNFRS